MSMTKVVCVISAWPNGKWLPGDGWLACCVSATDVLCMYVDSSRTLYYCTIIIRFYAILLRTHPKLCVWPPTCTHIHHFYGDDEKTFFFFLFLFNAILEKNELHLKGKKRKKNTFNWSSIDFFWRGSSAVWFTISVVSAWLNSSLNR